MQSWPIREGGHDKLLYVPILLRASESASAVA